MFLWASCFPLLAIGVDYSPHITFAALRAVLAGVILIVFAFAQGKHLPRSPGVWFHLCLIGLGATSLGFLGMFHAAELVSPGIATVIANTQPLFASVLAVFVLNVWLSARGIVAIVVCFLGVVMIALPKIYDGGGTGYVLGIGYIFLAAIGISVSNVFIKKVSGRVDALMAMGLQMLIGSVPLIVGAWLTEDLSRIQWNYNFVLVLFALALPGTALVYWLWCSVLERVQLNTANMFTFLVPFFGLGMGWLFFEETLSFIQAAGFGVTVIGIVLSTHSGAVVSATGTKGSKKALPRG